MTHSSKQKIKGEQSELGESQIWHQIKFLYILNNILQFRTPLDETLFDANFCSLN